jgi:hypothetical protein
MAETTEVRQYLAHWFQLGKKVICPKNQTMLLPQKIFNGDRYSPEFEDCWQKIIDSKSGDCYLEGTQQTIQELLSTQWDFHPCARCNIPVPIETVGQSGLLCPCHDLAHWPNLDLPLPQLPVNSQQNLDRIRQSLLKHSPQN